MGFEPQEFIDFLNANPSRYHAVAAMKNMLEGAGYTELKSFSDLESASGRKFFITYNLSSLIAFELPEGAAEGFIIAASHSDSPTFRIKSVPELMGNGYTRVNVERYGGMLCSTWLDRPLSLAGKLLYSDETGLHTALVNVDEDCLIIPNLAIHMSPKANDGFTYKANVDMIPLFATGERENGVLKLLAEAAGVAPESVRGMDVHLYNREKARLWGQCSEFISGGRLDDLQCAYTTLKAFMDSDSKTHVRVYYVSDNEEIGSDTKQGAGAAFLFDALTAAAKKAGRDHEGYTAMLRNSLMLSCDNAHAHHPNHPEMSDPVLRPTVNGGVVIKFGMRYTTDGVSEGLFRMAAEHAGLKLQNYSNRSDLMGGATLGNISNTKVPLNTVDIGIAQLAMHSSYETAGVYDTNDMYTAAKTCYEMSLVQSADGEYSVEWR